MEHRYDGYKEYAARLDAYKPYGSSKGTAGRSEDQKTVDSRSCVTIVSADVDNDQEHDAFGPTKGVRGRLEETKKAERKKSAARDEAQDGLHRLTSESSLPWTDVEHHSYMRTVEAGFVSKMYEQHYCDIDVCGNESRQDPLAQQHSLAWLEAPDSPLLDVEEKDTLAASTLWGGALSQKTNIKPARPSGGASIKEEPGGDQELGQVAEQMPQSGPPFADSIERHQSYNNLRAAIASPSTSRPGLSNFLLDAHAARPSVAGHLSAPSSPSASADIQLLKPAAPAWSIRPTDAAEASESPKGLHDGWKLSPLQEGCRKSPQHHQLYALYGLHKRASQRAGSQAAAALDARMAASVDVEASVSGQEGSCVSGDDGGLELHHHYHYHYHHIYDDRHSSHVRHPLHSGTPFDQLVPTPCPPSRLPLRGCGRDVEGPLQDTAFLPSPSHTPPMIAAGVVLKARGKRILDDDDHDNQEVEVDCKRARPHTTYVRESRSLSTPPSPTSKEIDPALQELPIAEGSPLAAPAARVSSAQPAAVWTWGLSGIRKRAKGQQAPQQ